MSFNAGGGNHDILRPEGSVKLGGVSYTDLAWQNRARLQTPAEHCEMFIAPNEGCTICLNGVEYVSRRDHQFGFVWDGLPCRAVNEFIQLQKVKLGEKGDNWIQLTLMAVRYPQPTS
jgi:hypothetical protein